MNKNWFWKIISDISTLWWCFWSNIRFHKYIRKNIDIKEKYKNINSIEDILKIINELYSKFVYTKDGIDELYDAITPPPQNYQHYLDGELKDDCDGFHSLVYHILYNNKINCCLLTTTALNSAHCILLFKFNNLWYINDYKKIYGGFEDVKETILKYNEIYQNIYKSKPVLFNALVKYNYNKGRFYKTSIKKIEKI